MHKIAKCLGMRMLALSLSDCDNSKDQETSGAPAGTARSTGVKSAC
ncbi:MAG: hypothetical protein GPOALKHO_001716 [Sodalis sp.]|nr:MAG: hypothetical protein GPOALKHO_001716 [Sodalis sp.]